MAPLRPSTATFLVTALTAIAGSCGGRASAPAQSGSAPDAPRAAAPAPAPALAAPVCADAAAGLQRGTRSLRPPDDDAFHRMRARCGVDRWPAAAIACFAQLGETGDGLGRCVGQLPAGVRERFFDQLGDRSQPPVAVAIAAARLATLRVGIAACDRFIETVAHVLACDAMAIEDRAQLGAETADFWSLPTSGLPADAQARMAGVCDRSRAALEQRAVGAGCAP